MPLTPRDRELRRKAVHAAGIVLWPLSLVSVNLVLVCLLALIVGYWAIEALAQSRRPLPVVQPLIESCKREGRTGKIDPGPYYMAAGVGLSFLFLPRPAALIGLIHISLADAVASIVPLYLKLPWKLPYGSNKTWVGSMAFLLIAWAGTSLFVTIPQALLLAVIGTVLESLPPRDIDNLTVPLGVALIATLSGWLN